MANTIIRQEINILDHILSAASGSSATSNEIVQFDTSQYNGATYYLEVVADSSVSLNFTVTLNGATDGTLATCTIPVLTTTYTRIRSASFTPTTVIQNCTIVVSNTVGATKNVKSARIIIIQNATTIAKTETQIEIGNTVTSLTNTTAAALTDPKYWIYNPIEQSVTSGGVQTSFAVQGATGTSQRRAMLFTVGAAAYTVSSIDINLLKTGSPTDNYYIEIVSGADPNGAALATSANVAASSTTTSAAYYNFTFATSYTLSASTTYYIRLSRTGARDAVNYVNWVGGDTGTNGAVDDSGVWTTPKENLRYKIYRKSWDGTKTFSAEVVFANASTKSNCTITLQQDDGALSFTDLVTIVNASTAATATRTRVTFTPTEGRTYRIASKCASSKTAYSVYCAKIIVQQGSLEHTQGGIFGSAFTGLTAETQQGQSFTTSSAYSPSKVLLWLSYFGSPTSDDLTLKITSSIGGSVLATSNTVSGTLLSATSKWITFTFASPPSLSSATRYFLQLSRSVGDAGAAYTWGNSSDELAAESPYHFDGATWSTDGTSDRGFIVVDTDVTIVEPQYLLLNTNDGGTGLQTYQTLWDSTEWNDSQGGLPAFKYSHDATNAADSSKLNDITTTVDVTGATVTGANQKISALFTMPTTGDELDTNVTVSTGVVGAVRILVYYAVVTAAAPPAASSTVTDAPATRHGPGATFSDGSTSF